MPMIACAIALLDCMQNHASTQSIGPVNLTNEDVFDSYAAFHSLVVSVPCLQAIIYITTKLPHATTHVRARMLIISMSTYVVHCAACMSCLDDRADRLHTYYII